MRIYKLKREVRENLTISKYEFYVKMCYLHWYLDKSRLKTSGLKSAQVDLFVHQG